MTANSSVPRLLALLAALALLAYGSFRFVHEKVYLAPGAQGLALGMAWLKNEYQLDDATFEKVTEAHRRYMRECAQRCHELADVNRHFLSEVQEDSPRQSDLDAVQILRESICHDCRLAMIAHVHEVAALMKEETGRRFITDVEHALTPSSPRRGRGNP